MIESSRRSGAARSLGRWVAAIVSATLVAVDTSPSLAACSVPDARTQPSQNYSGLVFKLSRAFPSQLRSDSKPWDTINFKVDWKAYLNAVLIYALEGNTEPGVDFYAERNAKRNWYHAPWMHPTDSGREFVHGLTRERGPDPYDLSSSPVPTRQAWAIGYYNEEGGYVLGKVWARPCDPDPNHALFPVGTVSFKLLFVDADEQQLPSLRGTLVWKAHINPDGQPRGAVATRTIRDVRLLQVDVAVRGRNATDTGWVFGTFVYHADAPGTHWWERLVPVSLQWGNDPNAKPGDVIVESYINEELRGKIFGWSQRPYLGWHGRANGPVDNLVSSCLSCHGSAQFPRSATYGNLYRDSMRLTDDERRKVYFRNIAPGALFDPATPSAVPLDYSLQLQSSFERLCSSYQRGELGGEPEPAVCARRRAGIERLPDATRDNLSGTTIRGAVSGQ